MSRIVVIGLSLSSSWGNGHATTYRALLRALSERGHDILFLECDRPWYERARDLGDPDFCDLRFYADVEDLVRWRQDMEVADLVILGSYVEQGTAVATLVRPWARCLAFYDIDTPVTLAALAQGECTYVSRSNIPSFDWYLSFTGGPILRMLEVVYGARRARVLYCAVDPVLYRPAAGSDAPRWHLGYLGTYSQDRQPMLERLMLMTARMAPDLRFVVAGPQYPPNLDWPRNVERIDHLPPAEHATFYNSLGWTLNVTRADMVTAGYSPSVRLFEAAACATPILSDWWQGLDTFFRPGHEIMIAGDAGDILAQLRRPREEASAIGWAARARVMAQHTALHRAQEVEAVIVESLPPKRCVTTSKCTKNPDRLLERDVAGDTTQPSSRIPR